MDQQGGTGGMSTDLQERVFAFIRDQIEALGFSPTMREIAERFDISGSQARSTIDALIRQRRIERTPVAHRNLCVAGVPDLRGAGTEALRAELARRGVTMDAMAATRPIMTGRSCAAHACDVRVRPGMLMCRDHWFQVTKSTRDLIMASWSARDMETYQLAVEEARDQVGGFDRVVDRVA